MASPSPSPSLRSRVEMQGFLGLPDDVLIRVEPWLRFSPAICAAWAATATWTASVASLWLLVLMAVGGAVLPRHPFDALYNHGIRHLTATPPIPRYAAPRRFACAVGAAWLGATAIAFGLGAPAVGRALGSLFTVVALVPVLTGFCLPSFLYGTWRARSAARQPDKGTRRSAA